MSRIGRKPIPVPATVTVTIEPEVVRVAGPRGELSERVHRDITVAQEDGELVVTPPDRPRRAPRPARADALARGQHGRGRHDGLPEDPRDPGRRLPRAAARPRPRARARLLAPGLDQGAGRHRVRGARSPRASSSRASPSSSSARSPPTSASSGRRSPTRARASATRASTSPGRSASAHDRHTTQPARAPQAPPPRPREGHRHRRAAAHLGVPLQPRASPPSSSTTRPAARWPPSPGPRPSCAASAGWSRPAKAGELLAERAKAAGIERAVFDRGGYQYHGRVKAFADGVREGGLAV